MCDVRLADNVVDFGVRCYVRDSAQPTGLRLIFPAAESTGSPGALSAPALRAQRPANTVPSSIGYPNSILYPEVVDIMLRVLTDEGSRLIAAFEQADSRISPPDNTGASQFWWQLVTANSHVFTRRVIINTHL